MTLTHPQDAPGGKRGGMGKMEPALIKDQVREFIMKIALRRGVPKLADDDITRLEAALRPESVSGPRYNEKAMAWVDR